VDLLNIGISISCFMTVHADKAVATPSATLLVDERISLSFILFLINRVIERARWSGQIAQPAEA
jgi:hypothetical protein